VSRRLPTSPLALVFVLLAGAILVPLLAPGAEAFGERSYESNTVISGTNRLDVHAGQSVAQSFTSTQTYDLWNVTLRLRNTGDTQDAINVTIREDAAGVPAVDYLAAQDLVIGTTLGQYDVSFAARPLLARGAVYWIVATCSSILSNGYEWHHSAGDVYAGGQAKVNLNLGGGWTNPASPTDLYFRTFGRELEANVTAAMSASTSGVDPGELVTFRVYVNNTGTSTASVVWLNDTGLPGFTYVSDTAASVGASTPYPRFTFLNLPNGPRSFDLVARVAIDTEPGTILTKTLTVVYRDSSGAVRGAPDAGASLLIGKQGKAAYLSPDAVGAARRLNPTRPLGSVGSQVNLTIPRDNSVRDFDLAPALTRDFRILSANATLFIDSIDGDAVNLDVNLTLADWNGVTLVPLAYVQRRVTTNNFRDYQAFFFSFPPVDHTFTAGSRIRLSLRNLGSSQDHLILAMNSTFAASRLEFDTTTYVRIDALDLSDAVSPTAVWSPKDDLVVRANVSDPLGSGEIASARIDVTTPGGTLIVNRTQMTLVAVDPATPSAWKVFAFTVNAPLQEGVYTISVTAFEANGVSDTSEGTALVRAPAFTLKKTATEVNVRSGDRFTYDIWFNNTGTGPAGRVWLNDSLPFGLTFLASSDAGAMTGNYNWTWASVSPGSYRLQISVEVQGGLQQISYFRNTAFLGYTDEKGFPWPTVSAFVDVAFRGPVISLSKTSLRTTLHANETITYTFTMQNTGERAETMWLNDTLPQDLTYVSDTAGSIGGTVALSGNAVYFTFPNMPQLSTRTFTLTAEAGPGLPRGAILTNTATLNYTNSNGILLPPRNASWSVTIVAPDLVSAIVSIARTQAVPSDVVGVVVSFANAGNEAARDVWMNLTFDPEIVFLNASVTASASGPTSVRFVLNGAPIGVSSVFLNVSANVTVLDRRLLAVGGSLNYTDGFRNLRPSVMLVPDSFAASVPVISLVLTPNEATLEPGSDLFLNVYQINAGSGVAGDVWLTLSLPAGFVYVNDTADVPHTQLGVTFAWHWSDFGTGAKSFVLQLRALTSFANGTGARLTFHTDYTDANDNFRPGITKNVSVTFVAPIFQMTLLALRDYAFPGETARFALTIRNVGGATAFSLWLEEVHASELDPVTYTSRVPGIPDAGGYLNWTYTVVEPGQVETIDLELRIKDGTPARNVLSVAFNAEYTNSAATGNLVLRSNTAAVTVSTDYTGYFFVGLAALVASLVGMYLLMRYQRIQIEEVFLVYRDGVLIYHLSRSLTQDKDEDVLSGMLTAVQEFVRDAFAYGEHRELHQLDFGDYRIMIERGRTVYLAVVYSGSGSAAVRRKIRSVLDRIEFDYAPVLEKWDGDMDKVRGARDLIREYLLRPSTGLHFRGNSKRA